MTWAVFVVLFGAVGGSLGCLFLFWSHITEDRERRRIQIHQWKIDAEREERLRAASSPHLFKGYKTYKSEER